MVDEDIERRLQNWARWKVGGRSGGLGFASVNVIAERVDGDRYRESIIPTVDAEAADTDAGIMQLPSELRRTVEVFYLHGGGMAHKARRLVCAESTIYARLSRAKRLLSQYIAEINARRRSERQRVETLIQAARP